MDLLSWNLFGQAGATKNVGNWTATMAHRDLDLNQGPYVPSLSYPAILHIIIPCPGNGFPDVGAQG